MMLKAWNRFGALPRAVRAVGVLLGVTLLLLAGPHERAAAVTPSAPVLIGPAAGTRLADFNPTLRWSNPPQATQVHLQVTPFNNDGPGVDLHLGEAVTNFEVPPPPEWYGLLPDMTYTWRVRVSDSPTFANLTDPSWSEWSASTFHTPARDGSTITALTPTDGATIGTSTPTLQWADSSPDVFYYEFQFSADPAFVTDPARAAAAVYNLLLHGALTRPLDSYTTTLDFRLQQRQPYYWRVRPRIQGDGTPAAWSPVFRFTIDTNFKQPLSIAPVSVGTGELIPDACVVNGAGTSFTTSPTFTAVRYGFRYVGTGTVVLNLYRGTTPLAPLTAKLDSTTNACYSGEFKLSDQIPAPPDAYRVDVLYNGNRAQSADFTVTAPASLSAGPITAGTGASGECGVTGVGTAFPTGTKQVTFRWNTAGTGEYKATLFRASTVMTEVNLKATAAVGCATLSYDQLAPGTWLLRLASGTQTLRDFTFTVAGGG